MENLDSIIQKKLPNATAVLALGIASIPMCCCIGGLVGLALSIIALILAKKDMAIYQENPNAYLPSSFSNLKAGRICAIVGICLSGIYFLMFLFMLSIFGFEALSNPQVMQDYLQNMR
jgi:hypothetical protein